MIKELNMTLMLWFWNMKCKYDLHVVGSNSDQLLKWWNQLNAAVVLNVANIYICYVNVKKP